MDYMPGFSGTRAAVYRSLAGITGADGKTVLFPIVHPPGRVGSCPNSWKYRENHALISGTEIEVYEARRARISCIASRRT